MNSLSRNKGIQMSSEFIADNLEEQILTVCKLKKRKQNAPADTKFIL
jgi:hypothetical protein